MQRFRDRVHAGQQLVDKLQAYADRPDAIVLALPRGGLPVAFEVSQALHLPLDAFLVRKLGVPGQEELAMGAIAMGGMRVLNKDIIVSLGLSKETIESVAAVQEQELQRRNDLYRQGKAAPEVKDRAVILVDDGIATGATIRSAIAAITKMKPSRLIVAVPVSALDTFYVVKKEVDEIICLETPEPFYSVGSWYEDFPQTSDEEVQDFLSRSAK